MIISRSHQRSPHSSTDFSSTVFNKPTKQSIFRNRSASISDLVKEGVYNQCRSVVERSLPLGPLQYNNSNAKLLFSNRTATLQDVYLLLRYSPRRDDEDGFHLQLAASYLLSQSLQKLSIQQQMRTRIVIFLNETNPTILYKRLERWFKSIYDPYTTATHIIRMNDDHQTSLEFMMNYTKYNVDIHLDTILFLLEDYYIVEAEMLSDTIEFFAHQNPCFVYQPDYSTDFPGRTRLWRSIFQTTFTFACRLRTYLAFEDIIMHSGNNRLKSNRDIRTRAGDTVFFCAIPSYGTHLEKLRLPNEVNITTDDVDDDTSAYYKDWWSIARHALVEAQKKDSFPTIRINERNRFV